MTSRSILLTMMLVVLCLIGMVNHASAAMTSISPCPLEAQDEMSQLYIDYLRSRGDDGSCDAACEQKLAQMERRACEYAVSGMCYTCDPATCSKYGISCGSTGPGPTPTPPPPDGDGTWIVIVGVLVVIGGGLAIGAKKLSGGKGEKAPGEKKKKKEPEKVRYILQLSNDRLKVTPEATANLKVTAWKVVGDSPPAPAPEAAITLTVPAGSEGLSVQPASGTGTVEASIALVSQVAQSPVPITVTASAGKSSVASQVMVEIPAEYLMEFF